MFFRPLQRLPPRRRGHVAPQQTIFRQQGRIICQGVTRNQPVERISGPRKRQRALRRITKRCVRDPQPQAGRQILRNGLRIGVETTDFVEQRQLKQNGRRHRKVIAFKATTHGTRKPCDIAYVKPHHHVRINVR